MNITEINVPKNVRYISQWKGFMLENFPHIIDKQIPGCGFTEYCITNPLDLILVCPRKILLQNKENQHPGEVFYAKSELLEELSIDKNLLKIPKIKNLGIAGFKPKSVIEEEKRIAREKADRERAFLKSEIESYWFLCQGKKKPAKILVTYDSFRKVKEILQDLGIFENFYTVIDEFQSIFVDSRFKADTEMEFIDAIKDIQRVCYVSATPMIESYLDRLDQFKDLPYYKFNWVAEDPGRVSKPGLTIRALSSVNQVAEKVIDTYKAGNFETSVRINKDGSKEIVESKEAVFYVNSVSNILGIIKKCDLKPEQVNILCANNTDNINKIKQRLGAKYTIGEIPLKGQPHKMFTFCTRTVYLGADFYSDNARSFVISDANKETLAVDITLDLPQILGRQRLESNPWKNKATIFVKTARDAYSREEFDSFVEGKMKTTKDLLLGYDSAPDEAKHSIADTYLDNTKAYNYEKNYVAVNKHAGLGLKPEINKLVLLAEERAFDIQQVDYADRFTVFNRLEESFGNVDDINKEVSEFLMEFDNQSSFERKMKFICTSNVPLAVLNNVLDSVHENFKTFYLMLGPERCRACGYKYTDMKRELDIKTFNTDNLSLAVINSFVEGEKYTSAYIKSTLKDIYQKFNYKKTAKATDIEEYFTAKLCRVKDPNTGTWGKGYEIIKRKL